ncbi:MAG: hypothetical protein J6S85_03005 [Methanobrevibacter sp.]|nr:hypothetical protein [Methanobrevibacter sp.]
MSKLFNRTNYKDFIRKNDKPIKVKITGKDCLFHINGEDVNHILRFVSDVGKNEEIKKRRCKEFISLIEKMDVLLKDANFQKMPYKNTHPENAGYFTIIENDDIKYKVQANKRGNGLWLNNISYQKEFDKEKII